MKDENRTGPAGAFFRPSSFVLGTPHEIALDDHRGRPHPYRLTPLPPGRFESAAWRFERLDRDPAAYRVAFDLTAGRLTCDCEWSKWHPVAPCKHRKFCEEIMSKRKPDEPPPARQTDPVAAEAAPPARPASPQAPDLTALAVALAAPFDSNEIKFKPQTVSGNRALAVPFVDARVIQDRLDDVLGVMGWQDSYEVLPDGSVVCRLKIRLGEEWITKEDVGGVSEQPDEGDRRKASFSDALKRAAVKFGIGRYLYRQKPQWCDYDPTKRQFLRQPVLCGVTAPAPAKAAPKREAPALAAPPWHRGLLEYEARLAEQGLCVPGELVQHLAEEGKRRGHSADFAHWEPEQVAWARETARAFEQERRVAVAPAKAS